MPVPMVIGRVRIFVFPRSESGIFDLILNKIEHLAKVSIGFFLEQNQIRYTIQIVTITTPAL